MSMTRVDSVCPFCGKETTFEADTDAYSQFLQGMPAEEAFPYLSEQELEQLKTGICPTCYKHVLEVKDLVKRHSKRPTQIVQSLVSITIAVFIIVVLRALDVLDDSAIQYAIGFVCGAAIEAHNWWSRYEEGL